jgi:hypothetical protein
VLLGERVCERWYDCITGGDGLSLCVLTFSLPSKGCRPVWGGKMFPCLCCVWDLTPACYGGCTAAVLRF